ncbi:MAG: tRNA (adenosine(37)-N6)-threonylcarbamoyltransferase complex transferase subunit TsaD, partial [Patescibacteria group bacterium]
IHRRYGGVVPEVAAREHAVTILPTINAAMKRAGRDWGSIDAIAVTAGPGLNTALLVGVETARALSYVLKKPAVRVNHIEGHVVSAWASPEPIKFPAVALIVSGGHTELILVKRLGQYKLLGRTLDDAVGEAFDKVAKILGLPYPGGPAIAIRAARGDASAFTFPRALMRSGNLDFSYSGLKTSVLYELQKHRHRTASLVNDLAAGFQVAAVEPLVTKTRWAVEKVGAKTVLLGGGVAANMMLREKLLRAVTDGLYHVRFVPPSLSLCMDNGVMIAMAACLRLGFGGQGAFQARQHHFTPWRILRADPNWELV